MTADEWFSERTEVDRIDHSGSARMGDEFMSVAKRAERAGDHLIGKALRTSKVDDRGSEPPAQAEMPGFKGHEITKFQQVVIRTIENPLARTRGALDVHRHAPRKVEASIRGSKDKGLDLNPQRGNLNLMPLSEGTPAPDFTLKTKDAEGLRDVRLSDHRGKENVVLLFYPGAYTHICTQEMCDVTAGLAKFAAASAQVYGVSNDTPFVLENWANGLKIGFPLLSDFQHEVARAYDVVWPDFAGLGPGTARAVFLIDKEGVIRYAEQTPTLLDFPNYEALDQAIASLDAGPVA